MPGLGRCCQVNTLTVSSVSASQGRVYVVCRKFDKVHWANPLLLQSIAHLHNKIFHGN